MRSQLQLVRDRAVVGVHAEPRTAGLDPQRLVGRRPRRGGASREQPVGDGRELGRGIDEVDHGRRCRRRWPACGGRSPAVQGEHPVRRSPAPGSPQPPGRRQPVGPDEDEHRPLGRSPAAGSTRSMNRIRSRKVDAAPHRCPARRRPRWCRRGRPARGGARRARAARAPAPRVPARVGQPVEVLAGQAVQPGQPVGARDGDDVAVAAVDQTGALGEQPLLAQRVAVVSGVRTRGAPALDLHRPGAGEQG